MNKKITKNLPNSDIEFPQVQIKFFHGVQTRWFKVVQCSIFANGSWPRFAWKF